MSERALRSSTLRLPAPKTFTALQLLSFETRFYALRRITEVLIREKKAST